MKVLGQAVKTDLVLAEYRDDLKSARIAVNSFLEKNGFQPNICNQKKGKWFKATYPLHVAVKQNDAYICSKLLMFGADLEVKDIWGRTAFDYIRKDSDPKITEAFDSYSKYSWMLHCPFGRSKLQRIPPPLGFEKFFADLEHDPLVQVPNCESQWLLLLGPRHVRTAH